MSDTHWFEPIAARMGATYLRYAHTKGTSQEVDHLVAALGLAPGQCVLDVGCGPGRHAHELARRGILAHGVDVSARFVELAVADAPAGASFERRDARALPFDAEFDAAICLCQGAFGMMRRREDDAAVLAGIHRALRPGGRLALTAFNAFFVVKYHDGATFDPLTGVAHEVTEVHDEHGAVAPVDLWTGCATPRELALLLAAVGFDVAQISSVEPGAYADGPATTELPELLVIATRT